MCFTQNYLISRAKCLTLIYDKGETIFLAQFNYYEYIKDLKMVEVLNAVQPQVDTPCTYIDEK
jgi:hypothetical protein